MVILFFSLLLYSSVGSIITKSLFFTSISQPTLPTTTPFKFKLSVNTFIVFSANFQFLQFDNQLYLQSLSFG